ncbi:MAG: hypothetical protein HY318_04765 [Armatimonadetes bacterium]|nr:hypothetical protein [Armatimonadota bacterium]
MTFKTTAAGDYAVGDATLAYAGRLDKFLRHVVFLRPLHTGGEPIIVLRDELAAPKPSTYQFLLHALNKMEVDAEHRRVIIAKGASRCRVDYLAPQKLTFSQNDQFTVPPFRAAPNQWHLTASTVEPTATTESLIVLQPHRVGDEKKLLTPQVYTHGGRVGVRLTGGDRTLLVLFSCQGGSSETPSDQIQTDAQVASFSLIANTLRSAVLFEGTKLTRGAATLLQSDACASLSCSRYGDTRRLVSSDAPPKTRLAANLGHRDAWTQGEGLSLKAVGGSEAATLKPLEVSGQKPAPFEVSRYDYVQRLVAQARVPGTTGHYAVNATVDNTGNGELPITLAAGALSVRQVLAPHQKNVKVSLPAANLGGEQTVAVTADEAFGGQLVLKQASATRVFNLNLIPNGSFEEVTDGMPVGWSPASITKNARSSLSSGEGGRNGGKCLKVTCTDATGGDFGAILQWPGIKPSDVERKFRMSCWVKTDTTSVAGLQITSGDWSWWKNTERLKDRKDWTETSLEFVLPAGQDITHVRLHMNAEKTGAELLVDEVSLVEMREL